MEVRAVNFIVADLRDVNFSGADLSTSIFLSQMQINSTKGDVKTTLPSHIHRTSHWIN
ncbi:pentapeptide repeat-containing protein [Cytobacillus kochii]|uniref:pentapeptide repeat-containing protein n=1 Tax=Cytobacillus kochii TaxID=859143 RepID=UPI002E1F0B2D